MLLDQRFAASDPERAVVTRNGDGQGWGLFESVARCYSSDPTLRSALERIGGVRGNLDPTSKQHLLRRSKSSKDSKGTL